MFFTNIRGLDRRIISTVASAALLIALGPAMARADDGEVLAKVNGKDITVGEVNLAKEAFAAQLGQVPDGAQQGILVDVLIDMHVLADAAEKAGIGDTPDFAQRMAFLKNQALRNTYIEDKIQGSVTDEEMKARYEKDLAGYTAPEEVHARHILVKTEDEAKDIIAQLDKGGDFAELAKEHSLDGSKANGGDLGFFTRGQMVPEFENAAFELEPGKYTETPVKSQFGYHIIKVEEKRQQPAPTFDEVKDQVRQVVAREKFAEIMKQLKAEATVERLDQPAADAAPATDAPAADAPAK
ncbi:putative peptidyl-prolyl cis-trans isomerase Cbf2 precursor [Hartmannibacter diazotrophicus]|uniref:Parvulin-like PPIase n=1 Tax=Hartmannibacter diazotrophicus TaxID=1482074 RepID=A0A2C9DB28_9HYPH|nr:peptidylprolyl isomerase [Hartmannibacter diazotrophicus]SON57338.1 putative peptidyl-prolyl cis-trans isomerase Cbf2 precursor [Hartmannibacter diazotrophicus]